AASSVRSAAYCGRVRARSSISDGRSLARSCQSNGLKFWSNQSALFRHPTNANSIPWQHLPKVLINRPISNRQGCCTSSQNSGGALAKAAPGPSTQDLLNAENDQVHWILPARSYSGNRQIEESEIGPQDVGQ